MHSSAIAIVQQTYAEASADQETAAALFYNRLFELDPTLRALFMHDIEQQGAKLILTLRLAVKGLNTPETIRPMVTELGKRHVSYGVKPDHYAIVGQALLWMLQQRLGEAYTDEVENAWQQAYALLRDMMTQSDGEPTP